MKPKTYFCTDCDAEFMLKHEMDEDYYEVRCCAFCGADVETELDFEEDE